MNAELVALLVAILGVIAVIVGGLFSVYKLNKGVQNVHVLVNSNLSKVRLDLRMAMLAIVLIVLAAIAALFKGQQDGAKREGKK